ncbi:bestrophin family ion channel [Chitinophaga pollutisoli]|uniref:Bestrophin family ion channel n=1 Tax=Chitinophaga pollutisoli TaxID=3133966 RepID=A0ABZ2YVE1_9BACT
MLLRDKLSLVQVFRMTWKLDITMIVFCTMAYYIDTYWLREHISIPLSITAVLGTALAFFIGFNNNQAYDRWWEGRKIWGSLVNDSRTWARDLMAFVGEDDGVGQGYTLARRMVFRHLAFVYALKSALRKDGDTYYQGYLNPDEVDAVAASKNAPNAILQLQANDLRTLRELGAVDGFLFRDLNSRLTAFSDQLGMCERIRNTIFPPSYLFFTRVFIWFYVMMTTFSLTENIGGWAILFGWAVGFVFHVTHQNGLSIMDPFETNPMSLPLNSISRTIEINLLEMLGHSPLPSPVEPVGKLYIL